jgi:hypothetical protein
MSLETIGKIKKCQGIVYMTYHCIIIMLVLASIVQVFFLF